MNSFLRQADAISFFLYRLVAAGMSFFGREVCPRFVRILVYPLVLAMLYLPHIGIFPLLGQQAAIREWESSQRRLRLEYGEALQVVHAMIARYAHAGFSGGILPTKVKPKDILSGILRRPHSQEFLEKKHSENHVLIAVVFEGQNSENRPESLCFEMQRISGKWQVIDLWELCLQCKKYFDIGDF